MRPQSLAIVGIDYPNAKGPTRRFELEICRPGEPVDEHAIAVYSCRGIQLGYIKSERAVFIGTLWRQGHTSAAIFQALDTSCGWIRIAFDGDSPALPAFDREESGPIDDGFFPDPIYDDD
jgi:hypothetical protein